ncbi:hypothetical protein ACHMW6_00280 (plasmid) [Pseudoduganella sp. UC29_106]|uniref:hypothetical protein n=1 Tax=Pseudoduganella sp. UC29_106 TaxID=3374553 RepID=UPI00375791DD
MPIDEEGGRKAGRPSSGVPRAEQERRSQVKNRAKKQEQGKVELRTWVKPETRQFLTDLVASLKVQTAGEVLDVLLKHEALDVVLKQVTETHN